MRIDCIELRYCELPLTEPWRTSFGTDTETHTLLVRLIADGVEGWGESSPLPRPTYSPECSATCWAVLAEVLLPALAGAELNGPADVARRLAPFRGNPFAKAAVETAAWDLEAHRRGEPLGRLLGGTRSEVEAGADFGIQTSIDVLLEKVAAAVAAGHPRIKLKIGHGHDIEVVRAVREAFPDLVFHVDCNACYSLADDLPTLQALDAFELAMIEQPLHYRDLVDHAELQRRIATPVCLDESVHSVRDFELALRLGSCRAINIKPGRIGGLAAAVEIERRAREAGMPAWVGGMFESGIGVGLLIELASLPGFTYPGDLFPSERFYAEDLTAPVPRLGPECTFAVSTEPGTGYQPHIDRIERATTRVEHF